MATRPSKSARPTVIGAEPDRISCLPDPIIDRILSHLPLRDAVRTSVLSYKWRYKWATMPNLVFNKNCVSTASEQSSVIERELLTIIDHVLLLHSGPINRFVLCFCGIRTMSMRALDRWIFHVTKRSIKDLTLGVPERQRYKLPWCLFSCQSLHHLNLNHCLLKPPSMIEGFKNLKSLELHRVTMAQDSFDSLISGCPMLEKLTLVELDGFTQINIHAPNLKILYITGKFEDISFDNTFQLVNVVVVLSLYLNSKSNQSRLHGSTNNLLNFFAHLHHVQHLEIDGDFLKHLAADVVPIKLPTPYINLTYLWLSINFKDLKEISAALCVFMSSPNLNELNIYAHLVEHNVVLAPNSYGRENSFLWPDMPIRVRDIWIEGISGTKYELSFIRTLLQYSPFLEQMTVKPVLNARSELILQLMRFKRASTQAEIIYDGKVSS